MQKDFSLPKIHQRQLTESNINLGSHNQSTDLQQYLNNMSTVSRYPQSTKNMYGTHNNSINQQFSEQIKQIDNIETRLARMTPVNIEQLEREIQILKQPIQLNNLKNSQNQHHIWLQEDTTINLELLKKQRKYCKFNLRNSYPLKIKASSQDGNKFGLYMSFTESFPDETMEGSDIYSYHNRADHLYKFYKPKVAGQHVFITFRSEEFIKINVKFWFSDKQQELQRQKRYEDYLLKHKAIVVRGPKKVKQIENKEETERQKQIFNEQVQYIKQKRKEQNKKYFTINVIERNRQIADNLEIFKKKKVIDQLMHDIKCEEIYRKNINKKVMDYQANVSKIVSRSIQKEMSYKINQRKKYMEKINKMTFVWLTLMKLTQITEIMEDKIKMTKLSNLFIHRKKLFAKNLKEKFNSNRDLRWNTRKQTKIYRIEGLNAATSYAHIIKKKAKSKAGDILVNSLNGLILQSLLQKLQDAPFVFLTKVKFMQRYIKHRKKVLRQRVQTLLEIHLKVMIDEGESCLEDKEKEFKECLKYIPDFRYGHKLEIVLRYLRIQTEKYKKSYKVFKGVLDPQEDDWEVYDTVMKKSEAIKENLTIKEEIDPQYQQNLQQFMNKKNMKSLYQTLEELKQEKKQQQQNNSTKDQQDVNSKDIQLVLVEKKRIREPSLFLYRDRKHLKQYILYALKQIQTEEKRNKESELLQQQLKQEKEEELKKK